MVSPPYPCQLVLVAKLAAVLNEESGVTAPNSCGFQRQPSLKALQRVEEEQADHAEQQEGEA